MKTILFISFVFLKYFESSYGYMNYPNDLSNQNYPDNLYYPYPSNPSFPSNPYYPSHPNYPDNPYYPSYPSDPSIQDSDTIEGRGRIFIHTPKPKKAPKRWCYWCSKCNQDSNGDWMWCSEQAVCGLEVVNGDRSKILDRKTPLRQWRSG